MTRTLCIDLGGTNIRAGLLVGNSTAPSPLGNWPAPDSLTSFEERISTLLREHAADSLGIAVPGLVSGTRCNWAPNLPYLDDIDLAELFPDVALAAGNDAHFALLAEAAAGAARTLSDAILLAIGTGIGSAVLSDGRIVRGHRGSAASFGWACGDPGDPGDTTHGWLERGVSGTALDRLAERSGLHDGAALVAAARAGDRDAIRILEAPSAMLGAVLAGPVALLGSQAVIISGGVADALDVIAPVALAVLRRQVPLHLRDVQVTRGALGPTASLTGAGIASRGHALWTETVR